MFVDNSLFRGPLLGICRTWAAWGRDGTALCPLYVVWTLPQCPICERTRGAEGVWNPPTESSEQASYLQVLDVGIHYSKLEKGTHWASEVERTDPLPWRWGRWNRVPLICRKTWWCPPEWRCGRSCQTWRRSSCGGWWSRRAGGGPRADLH